MTSLTLRHRREIDLAKEQLVAAAESLLDRVGLRDIDRGQFGHSQLRNLCAVAAETESPAVVVNFIRFQMGRARKDAGWARRVQQKRLGECFIDELEGADAVISNCVGKIAASDPIATQLVRMELIRQFLGFATRYLRFLDLDRPATAKGAKSNE